MTQRAGETRGRRILWGARFLATAFLGSLVIALVSIFAGLSEQVAVLGVIISSLFGVQLSYFEYAQERDRHQLALLSALDLPKDLVAHADFMAVHHRVAAALSALSGSEDVTLQKLAFARLVELTTKITAMAEGKLVFEWTETWRTVYEELLRKPEVQTYRSVAWFRTADYWQDLPGRKSLELNCQLADEGLLIHRTVIVPESLWPRRQNTPSLPVREWAEKQHIHGIWIRLVREADIRNEPELLVDFGLYGELAVGFQIVDEGGRTSKYELDFRVSERLAAERLWERLNLFATSYADLLDREPKES